jgi:hypothetical protein
MDLGGFYVWKEKAFPGDFGHLNFITGAGGFLQNWLFGYAGLRYTATGLLLKPVMPPLGLESVRLRGLAFAGARINVVYSAGGISLLLVTPSPAGALVVQAAGQPSAVPLAVPGAHADFSPLPVTVTVTVGAT